jgi:phosphohistidine swiveling domain-containing protein
MISQQIKKNLASYKWEKWLDRPFGAFIMSLFAGSSDRKAMKLIGVDAELPAFVFQKGAWFTSDEVMQEFGDELERWMKKTGKTIFDVSSDCEKFYRESKKKIAAMIKGKRFDKKAMQELEKMLRINCTYIWVAHGLEEIYTKRLKQEVPKYWKGDVDLFIGDISFPKKKNAHAILEEKLRGGEDLNKLVKEFGWMRVRDGFSDPFTLADLKELRGKIKNEKKETAKKITIPKQIKKLVDETKELVFYRTYRTDIFYELIFLSRPILKNYGKSLGLEFKRIRNCRIGDLIKGKVNEYPELVTAAQYRSGFAFFDGKAVEEEINESEEIKGQVAFKGIVKGIVKIVKSVDDLPKVKDGDILVTQMTSPNFLVAMKRAIAFVTNEGGITCHAAIVAREMRKPCIIGTKIATKVLKDGDLVEVDANNGIVKILNK